MEVLVKIGGFILPYNYCVILCSQFSFLPCPFIYLSCIFSANFTEKDLGELALEAVLEPGDLLYFPRGTIHQVRIVTTVHFFFFFFTLLR